VDGSVEDDLPSAEHGAYIRPRNIAAVSVGNSIAVYDFLIYSFFAAQIGHAFFPSASATASLLASLAAFGAGFAARPLGAIAIGRIGDRRGRARAMQLSFLLMGTALLGIAMTPTYSVIGVSAPALIVLFRLIQGFAFGGELGASTAFLVEAAPVHRRGAYVSIQYLSQDIAVLAAGLIGFALAQTLPAAALDAWGWRLAFVLGGAILPIGYRLRRALPETLSAAETMSPKNRPAATVRRVAALAIVILSGSAVVTYVEIYLATYATVTLGLPAGLGFLSTITLGLCGVVFSPLGGWLSDRVGRKPVMVLPWLTLLLAGLPGFRMVVTAGTPAMLVAWTALVASCAALAITAALAAVAETLPPSRRSAGIGLIYAMSVAVFGGSTQFAVAWLTAATASPLAPAWYMTGAAAMTMGAMLLMPETATCIRRRAAPA
jgi:MHS family citrate/tricarballylate:H+ symporter-like MFS transporter